MTPLRELRRTADLSQQEFAALIDVPLNTFRMRNSGLRTIPIAVMHRAAEAVEEQARRQQLLSLDQLAKGLGMQDPFQVFLVVPFHFRILLIRAALIMDGYALVHYGRTLTDLHPADRATQAYCSGDPAQAARLTHHG